MNRTIVYIIIACVVFNFTVIFCQIKAEEIVTEDQGGGQVIMDKYQGPTVTISGKVTFTDYSSGNIEIGVRSKKLPRYIYDIAIAEISKPGKYSIKIPKDFGEVYITGSNISSRGTYSGNPLLVGSSDLSGIDIVIKGRESRLLMDTYQGPTVNISGNVIFSDYKEGEIKIIVSSKNKYAADIANIKIAQPGEYSLKAPKDCGVVYLGAVNDDSRASYTGNPLNVGSDDITKADIVFE